LGEAIPGRGNRLEATYVYDTLNNREKKKKPFKWRSNGRRPKYWKVVLPGLHKENRL
jgi:hypothetical protein